MRKLMRLITIATVLFATIGLTKGIAPARDSGRARVTRSRRTHRTRRHHRKWTHRRRGPRQFVYRPYRHRRYSRYWGCRYCRPRCGVRFYYRR